MDGPVCDDRRGRMADLSAGETTALPMQLWLAQMVLNFLWSPFFFGLHCITIALGIILGLQAVICGFIWVQWRENRSAALLFIICSMGRVRVPAKLCDLSSELTRPWQGPTQLKPLVSCSKLLTRLKRCRTVASYRKINGPFLFRGRTKRQSAAPPH